MTFSLQVLSDATARKYISGVAVHWYMDFFVPPSVLSQTHELFPDQFLLATEACNSKDSGWSLDSSWLSAEAYAQDILTVRPNKKPVSFPISAHSSKQL